MTVLPRGPRARRGNRRPGWMLLTVLLVLAIVASSALVFTNRVELLKLAVILALWAAVAAAFVSVIYRRQSDHDQAKARDLKLVYDLQLDREISARREYELTVESQLRREIANELQAQAADEVAALRAELAALRTNLEILFDTDLAHRPAIENERTAVRAYSDWAPDSETTGRVSSSRLDEMLRDADVDESESRTEESPIIDVPAEPQPPEPDSTPEPVFGGAHRRPSEPEPHEPEPRRRRRRAEEPEPAAQAVWNPPPQPEHEHEPDTDPGITPLREAAASWERPAPEPEPEPEPRPEPEPEPQPGGWQPVPAEGQWIPPGAPGSHWVAPVAEEPATEYVGRRRAEEPADSAEESRRGRHYAPADETATPEAPEGPAPEQPLQGPQETAEEVRARRRRSLEDTGGQSVAELLARLEANPSGGGGRRRREP